MDPTLPVDGRNDFVGLFRASGYGYDWSFNGHGGGMRGPAWNADDDFVTKASAVFFQEVLPTARNNAGFRARLNGLATGDGQTHTIAFTENLDATTWGATNVAEMAFIVPVQSVTSPLSRYPDIQVAGSNYDNGLGPTAVGGGPMSGALAYDPNHLPYNTFPFANARINAFLQSGGEGLSPRPSSLHPGAVNVLFADGHAHNVNQTIDIGVYMSLVSPRGERHGQFILSDNGF